MILAAQSGTPVAVARVESSKISPTFTFTGSITVRRQALLSPRVSGLVKTVDIEAGDRIQAGDVILELDSTLAAIELRLMESDLALAQAGLKEAQRLVNEANDLGDSGFPRSARLTRETELEQAKLTALRTEAEVEAEKELIQRHKIIAPFSGIIAQKLTEMGEWVETGDSVIELVGDGDFRLEVRVPQERINEALQTETVIIRLPGLPGEEIRGRVDALGPVVDPGTRTFLVRITIENPPPILKPGMSAVAVFQPESTESVFLIPRDAIIRIDNGDTLVWTIQEGDDGLTASSRKVELGSSRDNQSIVISGLSEGERVVVRGNESLRENQSVRIVAGTAVGETEQN